MGLISDNLIMMMTIFKLFFFFFNYNLTPILLRRQEKKNSSTHSHLFSYLLNKIEGDLSFSKVREVS